MFFKRLEIRLTGPICSCANQDLQWGLSQKENQSATLWIRCRTCGATEHVSSPHLVASYAFDVLYPVQRAQAARRKGHQKHSTAISEKDVQFLHALRITPSSASD